MGRYVTEENLRYLIVGGGAGALAVAVVALFRGRVAWLAGWLGPMLALFAAGWWAWPTSQATEGRVVAVLVVGLVAGRGYEALAGARHVSVLALLIGLGGVYLATPETSQTVVMIGVVLGLALAGAAGAPGIGYGLGVGAAGAVLLGSLIAGDSFAGGLLCLSPLVAVAVVDAARRPGPLPAWPWFVIGSGGVSFAAARWIGVAPDATVIRMAVVAVAAVALAALTRR